MGKLASVQVEGYLDADLYSNGTVVFHGGEEAPFLDGLEGFLVEAHAERTQDVQVSSTAV
jgi:pyruvate-formate lyase-activating enzyme